MARVRNISKKPPKSERNFFVVDACFLANKYIQIGEAANTEEKRIIRESHRWWKEIDRQISQERARVYVPDLCIAEAFKVLAKKYYENQFTNSARYKAAREKLSSDVSMSHKDLQARSRFVAYHDVPATRDIIVAVGRFYELFIKHNCNVGVIDLVIVSTAKYLMDFHDAEKKQLHIVTHDNALWRGTKKVSELPNAYDPAEEKDEFSKVFR